MHTYTPTSRIRGARVTNIRKLFCTIWYLRVKYLFYRTYQIIFSSHYHDRSVTSERAYVIICWVGNERLHVCVCAFFSLNIFRSIKFKVFIQRMSSYIYCNIYMTHCVIVYGGLICYILPSSLITLDYMRSLNEPPSYVAHYLVFYWWNSSRNKKKCHSWPNFCTNYDHTRQKYPRKPVCAGPRLSVCG